VRRPFPSAVVPLDVGIMDPCSRGGSLQGEGHTGVGNENQSSGRAAVEAGVPGCIEGVSRENLSEIGLQREREAVLGSAARADLTGPEALRRQRSPGGCSTTSFTHASRGAQPWLQVGPAPLAGRALEIGGALLPEGGHSLFDVVVGGEPVGQAGVLLGHHVLPV